MEAISNYIENIFAAYPQTPELIQLKEELLGNAEERYLSLIRQGKSEQEALGTVIFEFGDMGELAKEIGVHVEQEETAEEESTNYYENPSEDYTQKEYVPPMPQVTATSGVYSLPEGEAMYFLDMMKKTGFLVGLGLALILFGTGVLVWFATLEAPVFFIMAPILLGTAAGVCCFIYAGKQEETSGEKFLKKNPFQLPPETEQLVTARSSEELYKANMYVAVGIGLTVLCPLPLFATISLSDSDGAVGFGVCLLLCFVGLGLGLIVFGGQIQDSYKRLLKIKSRKKGRQPYQGDNSYTVDYGEQSTSVQYTTSSNGKGKKAKSHTEEIFDQIFWPVVLLIFLVTGFVFHNWYINWIIWPIAGVVNAIVCAFLPPNPDNPF